MEVINTAYVQNLIKERPADLHKGQAGRVLIIAGSKGMAGAAVLATRGALYSGSGLIKVAVPDELFTILQISVPEAMCIERDRLMEAAGTAGGTDEAADGFLAEYDAVCIGPGIGTGKESGDLVRRVISEYSGPLLIDADGINCLCKYKLIDELNVREAATVLTPHPGEADRLLKALRLRTLRQGDSDALNREEAVRILAEATGAVVLLKGLGTLIADKISIFRNPTGNPGMATGGSGDVLSGIITSLMGQKFLGMTAYEAAAAGAFIHGLAGDIAAENIGEYGMTAADIADAISVVFKEI